MEKTIKKLYELDLEQKILPVLKADWGKSSKEWDSYNVLYEAIPEDKKRLLFEYISLRSERSRRELERAYTCGFKTAMKLMVEGLKE